MEIGFGSKKMDFAKSVYKWNKKKLVLVPFVAGDETLLIFSTDTFFYFSWNVSGDRYT